MSPWQLRRSPGRCGCEAGRRRARVAAHHVNRWRRPLIERRLLTERQRLGVVVVLANGAPVQLERVVIEQLSAIRSATVAIETVSGAVILEQLRGPARTVVAGFGCGVKCLTGASVRTEEPPASVRVRLVGR